MRRVGALLSFVLFACSSSNVSPAPTPPAPACTADAEHSDLGALSATVTYEPELTVALDDEGAVALTLAPKGELVLRRFALDGTERDPFTVATGVTLPGGDRRLSSLSLAYSGGLYFAAWEGTDEAIHARVLAADGTGAAATVVSPKTRALPGGAKNVTPFSPRWRVHAGTIALTWTEQVPNAGGAVYPIALYGADGARVDQGDIFITQYELGATFYFGDVDVQGDTLQVQGWVQGTGSIADFATVWLVADRSAPRKWTRTPISIEQPKGDVGRGASSLVAIDGGHVLVQLARLAQGNTPRQRIEFVWLDANGAPTATRFIPIADALPFFFGLDAFAAATQLHVVWGDSADPGGLSPTLHDATMPLAAPADPSVIDVPLSLQGKVPGRFEELGAPDLRAKVRPGGIAFAYGWSEDGGSTSITHFGSTFRCAAAH